jgi:hypothetical protein
MTATESVYDFIKDRCERIDYLTSGCGCTGGGVSACAFSDSADFLF